MKKDLRLGMLYMLSAAALFAVMSACVRALRTLGFMEVVFLRSLMGTLMVGGYLLIQKKSFAGTDKKRLFMRGIFGFLAMACYYFSITRLPLATANLLNNTAPVFVAVLAALFLKERLTIRLVLLILCCLAGITLLVQPEFKWNPEACTVGLISALFTAAAIIYLPLLKGEHPMRVIFYFVCISTLASAPWAFQNWASPDTFGWFLVLVIGVTSFLGQIFLTVAFRKGPASVISAVGYMGPVFTWILGIVLFHELLRPLSLAGAGMIVVSGALLSFLEGKTVEVPRSV